MDGSSKPDDNGMKATKNLIEKLMTLAKERAGVAQSPEPSPTRKRRSKSVSQHSKITSWLNRENEPPKRQKRDEIQKESKMKPLDIIINSDKSSGSKSMASKSSSFDKNGTEDKFAHLREKVDKFIKNSEKKSKTKSSRSLKRNSSFEKYGIALPSFEKIVADQKEFEIHRENVKKLDIFDENILHQSLAIDCLQVEEFTGDFLDCEHLSVQDLEKAFRKHTQTLKDILDGKKYSERHFRYHKQKQEVALNKDLRCSASLVVFTQDQKDYLLNLMREEFDPEDRLTSYFFKVLLPELCLFIFMDEHKMSKRKASAYLDKRPVD